MKKNPAEIDWRSCYEDKIAWLGHYYPTRSSFFDTYSRKILDFKEGKDSVVNEFYSKLNQFLAKNLPLGVRSFKLATIPRSKPNTEKPGFRLLFNLMKANHIYNVLNVGNVLLRHSEIPKQTFLQNRNIEQHLRSLRAAYIYPGDNVILLDDVLTTGYSMKAGIYILEQAGAKVLWGVALAKTFNK